MRRPRKKNTTIAQPRVRGVTGTSAMLAVHTPARYHPVDLEPLCNEENENPDWLVGAN
jgi:choline dehydrogenase-like flavoprotein